MLRIRSARDTCVRASSRRRAAAEQHCGSKRRDDRHGDGRRIQLRVLDAWQSIRAPSTTRRAQERRGRGDAGDAAGASQHQALDEQLTHEASRSGAERRAQRDLIAARGRPGEQQIGGVRASGEEHEEHRGGAEPKRAPHVADDGIEQRPHRDALAAIGPRESFREQRGRGRKTSPGLPPSKRRAAGGR